MDLKPFPQKKEFRGSFFASIFFYSVLLLSLLILFPKAGLSAQVTLAWDPNTESNLARYEVGYGTISRDNNSGQYVTVENVGLNTSYRVTGLTDGVTYYFGVRAVNTEGLQSGYSNEVKWPTATLSVARFGNGTGTVSAPGISCGTDCSEENLALGTTVTLTAAANAGSVFSGWSGACSGTSSTCTVTITTDTSVSATFVPNTNTYYNLTILKNGTGTGTVTNSPAGSAFSPGTVVTLTAAADANSVFSGWSGSCGSNPTCRITMNSNITVTAAFNLKPLTITASAGANGTVTPPGVTTVNYGSGQTYTITPASGYRITAVIVDGKDVGVVSSYTFSNVTSNHTISATFAPANPNTYTLTIQTNGTGTGTVTNSPAGTSFSSGTAVTLTATADASSVFAGWSGSCGSSPTCTVTMNSNTTVTAGFNLKTYTITATPGANGSIAPAGTTTVNYGASQTCTITPTSGYRVAAVTVDGSSVGAVTSYIFSNVRANHNITASFSTISSVNYSLHVFKVGSGRGTIAKNPSGDRFSAGTVVTLTAAPNSGSEFAGWFGACSGTNPTCTLTMNKDVYITASFKKADHSIHKIYLPLVIAD